MRWKTRWCALPVGDRDFSWCTGSDLGWYAVVWLLSALPSVIMCVLWAAVSQIPLLYSSLGWGEEDGNSSTHSALTPSACFYWSLIFLLIPLLQPPPVFLLRSSSPHFAILWLSSFFSPSSFLLSAQPDHNKCAMTEKALFSLIRLRYLLYKLFKLNRWRECSLKPAAWDEEQSTKVENIVQHNNACVNSPFLFSAIFLANLTGWQNSVTAQRVYPGHVLIGQMFACMNWTARFVQMLQIAARNSQCKHAFLFQQ